MRVRPADWQADGAAIRAIRTVVFVEEQSVPPEREIDGLDPDCVHVLALSDDGSVLGTARLLPDGHIGRMAVLKAHRGMGVGGAMLSALVRTATAGGLQPALNAQLSAVDFYGRHGFQRQGDVFIDAGIEHVHMRLIDR